MNIVAPKVGAVHVVLKNEIAVFSKTPLTAVFGDHIPK
jgi:hypothetical protein